MDLTSNCLREEKSKVLSVSTAVNLDTEIFSVMELVFYVHFSKLGFFLILSLIYLYILFGVLHFFLSLCT